MTVSELRHLLQLDMTQDYDEVIITDGNNQFEVDACIIDNGSIEIELVKVK